ncbi:MAG: low affinity iron permease family protein [Sphingomicrobium sp.]
MASASDKNLFERIGCQISSWASDLAAHPFAQIAIILFCALWWIFRLPTDILTAGLSILAITLTQMVLNRQKDREADAHRRDVAMHAKLDELLIASKAARNEMAGIEELDESDIEELKADVKETLEQRRVAVGEVAEEAADAAVEAAEEAADAAGVGAGQADPAKRRRASGK